MTHQIKGTLIKISIDFILKLSSSKVTKKSYQKIEEISDNCTKNFAGNKPFLVKKFCSKCILINFFIFRKSLLFLIEFFFLQIT